MSNFGVNSEFGFGSAGGGGGGGTVTGANNGLTLSGANVQLGQTVGAGGDPGVLLHNSEIPFGGFQLNYLDRATGNSVLFNPTSALGSLQVTNNQVNHIITGTNAAGFFAYWTPSNYLTVYPGTTPANQKADRFYTGYGLFTGVNPDGRPNVVGIPWAYNATVGGGRAQTDDAAFQFRTETHFILGPNDMFEFHLPEITTYSNVPYRLLSFYANKANGITFVNTTTDSWGWEIRDAAGPRFWSTLTYGPPVANVGAVSFTMDPDATASTSTIALNFGGQNMTDNGLGGAILRFVNNYADNFATLAYATPTGKTLSVECETVTFNDNIATGKHNFYGRVAIPNDGSNAGLSIGASVSAAFPVGAKLHIYGDGTTQATKAIVIDKGNPFDHSAMVFDDGTWALLMHGGTLMLGFVSVASQDGSTLQVGGSVSVNYVTTAINYNILATDFTIEITATGKTATLPTAVGITGRIYTIKLTSATSTGTVATTGGQTIDGAATYTLSAQFKYVTLQSNGANWLVIANN